MNKNVGELFTTLFLFQNFTIFPIPHSPERLLNKKNSIQVLTNTNWNSKLTAKDDSSAHRVTGDIGISEERCITILS